MGDFVKYILRGSLGGAIIPLVWSLLIFGLWVPALLLLTFPWGLAYLLWPGALVGLVLWSWVLVVEHVSWSRRAAIGSGSLILVAAVMLITYIGEDTSLLSFAEIVFGLAQTALAGASAGVCCPAGAKKNPKLTYRERVALYELNELEAKQAWKERRYRHI